MKTKFCKHDDGCIANILRGSTDSFIFSFGAKLILSLISILLNFKKIRSIASLRKFFLIALTNTDSWRFAGFLTLYTFIIKVGACFFKLIANKDQGKGAFISGAVAGYLSLSIIKSMKSRIVWMTFLITRALDIIYTNLHQKKYIKRIKFLDVYYDYPILLTLMSIFTNTMWFVEPDSL